MKKDKDHIEKERKAFKEELEEACKQPFVDLNDGYDENYDSTTLPPLDKFYLTDIRVRLRQALCEKSKNKQACRFNLIKQALIDRPDVVDDVMKRQVEKRFGVEISQAIRIKELETENKNLKKRLSQKE